MKIFIAERGAGSAGVRRIDDIAEIILIDNNANATWRSRRTPHNVYEGLGAADRRGKRFTQTKTNEVVAQLRKSKAIRRTDELKKINLVGLSCAGSILQLAKAIKESGRGQVVLATASDPLFLQEVATWCRSTANALHYCKADGADITAVVQKRGRSRSGRRERLSRVH